MSRSTQVVGREQVFTATRFARPQNEGGGTGSTHTYNLTPLWTHHNYFSLDAIAP